MYLEINSVAKAMYSCSASSWVLPSKSFQACHLYLPLKSKVPGLSVLLSPTVACLYKPYNFNNSSSLGLVVKLETWEAWQKEKKKS